MFKFVVILLLATLAIAANAEDIPCLGCTQVVADELRLTKVTNYLNDSLSHLAAGDGPVYKLSKINSANYKVITGVKYTINADLIDENDQIKTCDIELIYFRDTKTTFSCPDEEKVTIRHKH